MKKRIFYIIFFGIATIFFLYYLFPKEKIENYIDYQVYQIDPDFRLTLGDLRLVFPPYVMVSDTIVYYKKQPVINISSFRVRPGLAAIFNHGTLAVFKGSAHQGRFNGKIIRGNASAESSTTVKIDLTGIELDDINGLRSIPELNFSGQVRGNVHYTSDPTQSDQGGGDLVISDCTFQLANAIFDIKIVRFNRIEIKLDIEDRTVSIRRLEMTGPQINAIFDGQIELRRPFNNSQLNLSGKIRPHAEFMARLKKKIPAPLWPSKQLLKSGLPVSVTGTVRKPAVGLK